MALALLAQNIFDLVAVPDEGGNQHAIRCTLHAIRTSSIWSRYLA